MSTWTGSEPIFDWLMRVLREKENFTWRQRIALWLPRKNWAVTHYDLKRRFDMSYTFAHKMLSKLQNDGLCYRQKREGSCIVDYIFNDAMYNYAKYIFKKKVDNHVNFSWKKYLQCS